MVTSCLEQTLMDPAAKKAGVWMFLASKRVLP